MGKGLWRGVICCFYLHTFCFGILWPFAYTHGFGGLEGANKSNVYNVYLTWN